MNESRITGSRNLKLSEVQKQTLTDFIINMKITEFHHGDCVGADADVHSFIKSAFPEIRIVIHPPVEEKHRAFCKGEVVLKAKDYMDRNRDIVDASEILFCPSAANSNPRLGTGLDYIMDMS